MSPTAHPPEGAAPEPWPVAAYVVAFAGYVALGLLTKSWVLNWIVGPLFLVIVLHVVPKALRRLAGARR